MDITGVLYRYYKDVTGVIVIQGLSRGFQVCIRSVSEDFSIGVLGGVSEVFFVGVLGSVSKEFQG